MLVRVEEMDEEVWMTAQARRRGRKSRRDMRMEVVGFCRGEPFSMCVGEKEWMRLRSGQLKNGGVAVALALEYDYVAPLIHSPSMISLLKAQRRIRPRR